MRSYEFVKRQALSRPECHYLYILYRPSLDLFAQLFVALQLHSYGYAPSSRLDLNKNILRLFQTYAVVMTPPLKGRAHAHILNTMDMISIPIGMGRIIMMNLWGDGSCVSGQGVLWSI